MKVPTGEAVLQGPIPASGIAPLLQAVGIGRQTSACRVFDADATLVGELVLRSGKVLSVAYGESTGSAAFERFVEHREGTFSVSTVTLPVLPEPLGDLRTLLEAIGPRVARISLLRGIDASPPHIGTGVQSMVTLGSQGANVQIVSAGPATERPLVPLEASDGPKAMASAPTLYESSGALRGTEPPKPSAAVPLTRPNGVETRAANEVAPPKVEAPKIEAPKVEAPKIEVLKVEAPKAEPPRVEAPKVVANGSAKTPSEVRLPPNARVIAVVSPKGGVGKTTLSLNTAVALARRGLRTTLVDADPNGGISAAVLAHERRPVGLFDVLSGSARLAEALVESRMSHLRVLPAGGAALSVEAIEAAQVDRPGLQRLHAELARSADVVLIDTPGGAVGPTRVLLGCATHALSILQAEPLAMRAAPQLERVLAAARPAPELLGFVINMFDSRSAASAHVLQEACRALPSGKVFETPIPRTAVINEASDRGMVPAQADLATAPAIAWAFEQLAAEIVARLALERPRPMLDQAPLF